VRENSKNGRQVLDFSQNQFMPREGDVRRWRIPYSFSEGEFWVQIKLEDCLAFKDVIYHDDIPF